ncbi:Manganese/iron superoxide dismutase [Coemansia spiralis]|nr:Manganese/iron superoxide dismutase [Coemansia spiralis]
MFRLVSRSRTFTAQPLMQRFVSVRKLHQRAILPYDTESGLQPFLSAPSLDFLYNMRQLELVNSINRLTEGTEYEKKPLYDVIYQSAQNPSQYALLNYASQAWNIDFFLQSLTNDPRPIREDVKRQIASQFGSFDRFKDVFAHGKLSVMNIFNSGTPFTAKSRNEKSLQRGTSYAKISHGIEGRPFVKLTPVLCLSMWQESFLPDYGLDRETYVSRFWDVVDWAVVHERLMGGRSGLQMAR